MSKALASVLRTAIVASGLSSRELAKKTKVPHPTIVRFLNGADMRLSRAEKIAAYLGLELREKK